MDRRYRDASPTLVTALLLLLIAAPAAGDELRLVPSLLIKEEYNDNIFFATRDRESAFVTVIGPRIEVARRRENAEASATAGIDGIFYQQEGDLVTAVNQLYQGRAKWSPTPRLDLAADAGFRRNSRPDRAIEGNGAVLNAARRDRQTYGVSVGYRQDEITSGSASYAYEQEEFDTPTLTDTSAHSVGVSLVHDISRHLPPARVLVDFGFGRYDFSTSDTVNLFLQGGVSWRLSETLSLDAEAGGRYTRSEFIVEDVDLSGAVTGVRRDNSDGWGWVGRLSLTSTGERLNGSLSVNRNVTISSGRTGAAEATAVDATLRYYLSPKWPEWTINGTLGYQWNKSETAEFAATRIDEEVLRLNLGSRYEFTRDTALEASYTYTRANYHQSGLTADRNIILVSFTIRHDLLD